MKSRRTNHWLSKVKTRPSFDKEMLRVKRRETLLHLLSKEDGNYCR